MGLTTGLTSGMGEIRGRLSQSRRDRTELLRRLDRIDADILELRRHQLRLAELTDVVQELLVPLASRDEAAVAAAIEKFNKSL